MTKTPDPQKETVSRFRGRDGVTQDERDLPPSDSPRLHKLEAESAKHQVDQLGLFHDIPDGQFLPATEGLPPISARSSIGLARTAWRRHLEIARRPANTIGSYSYDLQILENLIGNRQINRIEQADIARYLGDASSKSTRKRRLTSVRRFFRYLIDDARVLKFDPTEGYYPHSINLRIPVPLFVTEQASLLQAAEADEIWSAPAIWLMMRLGLTRSELLDLHRDHIDRTNPDAPVVYVMYDDLAKQSKDRRLATSSVFFGYYERFLEERQPQSVLFPVGPQAINGMVDRVRKAADISRPVTPQTLRTTFAVEMARAGANQEDLLAMLGLANDPRNRASVDRYIKLGADPIATTLESEHVTSDATTRQDEESSTRAE